MNKQYQKSVEILKSGGIVVMPSDTVYGIFGSALNKRVVEEMYKVRRRRPEKPFIILVASEKDLKHFDIELDNNNPAHFIFSKGGISMIVNCKNKQFKYLYRNMQSLAFRIPSCKNERGRRLKKLLEKTGPLVAPSANLEGEPTVQTIREARNVFGDKVDFYISEGRRLTSQPSTLIKFVNGEIQVLRGKLNNSKQK